VNGQGFLADLFRVNALRDVTDGPGLALFVDEMLIVNDLVR